MRKLWRTNYIGALNPVIRWKFGNIHQIGVEIGKDFELCEVLILYHNVAKRREDHSNLLLIRLDGRLGSNHNDYQS